MIYIPRIKNAIQLTTGDYFVWLDIPIEEVQVALLVKEEQ